MSVVESLKCTDLGITNTICDTTCQNQALCPKIGCYEFQAPKNCR